MSGPFVSAHALAVAAHYFSTYCQHGGDLHAECRRKCKHCAELCRCGCHLSDGPYPHEEATR